MKNVPTFEQACELTGKDANQLPDTTGKTEIGAKRVIAEHKLSIIYEATCEGKVIDLSDGRKLKYTPWLDWVPSLGAFVCTRTCCTIAGTRLGARFWFEDGNTARYFGKTHIDLINDMMRPGF